MKYPGTNKRGRITIPEHAHPLVRAFIAEMNAQRAQFAEVARKSGVGIDTLRMWRWRHMPRLDLFDAALNTLDLELCIRRRNTRKVIGSDPATAVQA